MQTFNLFTHKTDELSDSASEPYIMELTFYDKKEMEDIKKEFHRQKEIYERTNGVLMS